MATIYKFKAAFTKEGVGTAPSPDATCTVVDSANNVLANAQAVTLLSNLLGVKLYSYTGADGLDLIALFHTSDTTMDQQDLYSYTPDKITTNLNAAISSRSSHSAADVWAVATRTLTGFGTLIADIWAAAVRSITDKTDFSLTSDYDAAKTAASQSTVNAIPTTPLLTGDARLPVSVIAAKSDLPEEPDNATIAAIATKLPTHPASEENVTSRLAASAYTTPPTVSQVAAAVWAWATRSLNAGSALVSVTGPVALGGDISLLAGDDYFDADGRALVWSSAAWPDLTEATVTFKTGSISISVTIVTAGVGISQILQLELTSVQSAALKGVFNFDIDAVLADTLHELTLVRANGRCE